MFSLKSPNLEIVSNGRLVSDQSLYKKPSRLKIQILIVDDDSTSLTIVSSMLKTCSLQDHMIELSVVTIKNPVNALETLRVKHGEFDLVVTDLHMPGMNGLQLQKQVNEEFKIPVILMSADDKKSVIKKSLESGAAFYMVKPVNQQDLNNVLEHAVASKKGKSIVIDDQEMGSNEEVETLLSNEKITCEDANSSSSSVNEDNSQKRKNGKKRERDEEQADEEDAPSAAKKAKVVWTNSLHNRFLQAINHIGLDKAVPKRILEFMCVPGLTRENVASHLQKYRMFLKKVAERGLWSSQLSERAYRSSFASGYSCGSSSMFGKYAHQDYSHLPGLQQFLKPTFHPGCGGPNNFFGPNNNNSNSSFHFPNHQEASSSNFASHPCRYGQSSLLFANNNSTSTNNFQRSMFGNPSYPFYLPNRSFNTTFGLTNNATNPLTTSTTTSPINPNLYNNEKPFKFGSGSSNYASSSYPSLNPNSNYAGIRLTSDGELIGSGQVRFSTRNYPSSSTSFNSTNNASTSTGNGIFCYLGSQGASSSSAAGFGNANQFSPIFTTIANNQENTSMLPPPLVSSQQPQTHDTGIGLGNVGGGDNEFALNLMNDNNSPISNNISNNQQQLGDGEADLGELLFGSPNYTTSPRQQRILEGVQLDVNFPSNPYNGVNELLNAEFSSSCTLADRAPWTQPSSSQLHARENMVSPHFGGNVNSLDNYVPSFEQPQVNNNGEPLVSELNGMHIDDKAASSDNQEWGEDFLDFLLRNDPY